MAKASENKKNFCANCGNEIRIDDKFCASCGHEVIDNKSSKAGQKNNNKTYRCTCCGATFKSFRIKCSFCHTDIRDIVVNKSLADFIQGLEALQSQEMSKTNEDPSSMKKNLGVELKSKEEKKIEEIASYIKNYPVPDSKEDLTEFMLLATNNVNVSGEQNSELKKAWLTKMEQINDKAQASINNGADLDVINNMYNKKKEEIKSHRTRIITFVVLSITAYIFLIGILINAYVTFTISFLLLAILFFVFSKLTKGEVKIKDKSFNIAKNITYIVCGVLLFISLIFGITAYNDINKYRFAEENYYKDNVTKYDVTIEINFIKNIMLNRYGIDIILYDNEESLHHGEHKTINMKLPNGTHQLIFKNKDKDITRKVDLVVKGKTKVRYHVATRSDNIDVREEYYSNEK